MAMHVSRIASRATFETPAANTMTNETVTTTLTDAAGAERFGRALAGHLKAGDVVFLIGALGAGKTTVARGVIAALTHEHEAPSPTYTLVQTYTSADTELEIWHADLYRIAHPDEILELGLEDAFDAAVTLIEWPDRLGDHRPADRLEVRLEPGPHGHGRIARLTAIGQRKAIHGLASRF